MKRKLENKINYLNCKLDITRSLVNVLVESMCNSGNLSYKDSLNLAYLLQNRINNIKAISREIIEELRI